MRHIALRFDQASWQGDLADVHDLHDVETEALVALATDARVPTSELPEGRHNRGWWADRFDPSGETTGSRLWLLEGALATLDNARRAEDYALEALSYLVRIGRARAVRPRAELVGEAILLSVAITLRSGLVRTVGPIRINGPVFAGGGGGS